MRRPHIVSQAGQERGGGAAAAGGVGGGAGAGAAAAAGGGGGGGIGVLNGGARGVAPPLGRSAACCWWVCRQASQPAAFVRVTYMSTATDSSECPVRTSSTVAEVKLPTASSPDGPHALPLPLRAARCRGWKHCWRRAGCRWGNRRAQAAGGQGALPCTSCPPE